MIRLGALVLLAAAMIAPAPAAGEPEGRMQRILDRGRLIVGVKVDYPPWGMVAPDGSIVGIEPDLARDAADRLGVGLELVPVTAGNRLQRLAQGQVDLVIATLGDTAERRAVAGLVQPNYYASGVGLLAPAALPLAGWEALRGRRVCLNEGAFFNRALVERYGLEPVTFPGTREALLALSIGRCDAWAFDDTVIARLAAGPRWAGFVAPLPSILPTPWAIAVARDERDRTLGRFVAGLVAEWHRSGRLIELHAAYGLPPSPFLVEQHALWSGAVPPEPEPQTAAPAPDGAPLLDPLNRARLLRGFGLTLALSLAGCAGALVVGVALAWADLALGPGPLARAARLPLRALVALARMTPPILQLYILFFGLGGLLAARTGWAPGSFLVAAAVLALYAGATNAVLIGAALAGLREERPQTPAGRLLPAALDRAYDGVVATLVNIVKAAGLASTIALPELVAAANAIAAESGRPGGLMTLLLVFYLLFVLAVLGALRAGRGLVRRLACTT